MNTTVMGVIGTSKKEDERRYPIHPEHLSRIPARLRRQLIFEKGYGIPFGIADAEIAALTGGIAPRHELLADIGMVIINKPVLADLIQLRKGAHFGAMCIVYSNEISPKQLSIVTKHSLPLRICLFGLLTGILVATRFTKITKWQGIAQSYMPCN